MSPIQDILDQRDELFDEKFADYLKEQWSHGAKRKSEEIKSFMREHDLKLLQGIKGEAGDAVDRVWKEMTDRTFNHTMKNKSSVFDVTEEDWQNSSFTTDEFKAKVLAG